MRRAGIEGGGYHPNTGIPRSVGGAHPDRASSFYAPTPISERGKELENRTRNLREKREALRSRGRIDDLLGQASEVLSASTETSNAVNKAVDTILAAAESLLGRRIPSARSGSRFANESTPLAELGYMAQDPSELAGLSASSRFAELQAPVPQELEARPIFPGQAYQSASQILQEEITRRLASRLDDEVYNATTSAELYNLSTNPRSIGERRTRLSLRLETEQAYSSTYPRVPESEVPADPSSTALAEAARGTHPTRRPSLLSRIKSMRIGSSLRRDRRTRASDSARPDAAIEAGLEVVQGPQSSANAEEVSITRDVVETGMAEVERTETAIEAGIEVVEERRLPAKTVGEALDRARAVGEIGVNMVDKAATVEGEAKKVTDLLEIAKKSAEKILSRTHTGSPPAAVAGSEERLSNQEIQAIVDTASVTLSRAEDLAIETVFTAIDAVREADSILPAQLQGIDMSKIEEAKEVVTKEAAKLFTQAEVKANAQVRSEVDKEAKAAGYTVEAEKKADRYMAGFTTAVRDAKTGIYTQKYANVVIALRKLEESTKAHEKATAEGYRAAGYSAAAAAAEAAAAEEAAAEAAAEEAAAEAAAAEEAAAVGYIEAVGHTTKESTSTPETKRAVAYSYKLAVTVDKARKGKLFSS